MRTQVRALPNGWWGMALAIATEATIFGSLIATYYFLHLNATRWPMGGIAPPDPLLPSVLTAALVSTSIPMWFAASAALRGRTAVAAVLIAVALAVQVAYIAIQLVDYVGKLDDFTPRDNAYGSVYYALVGVHHLHVVVGIALSAWVLFRLVTRGLSPYRTTAVRVDAMYWHFVNAMAIVVLLTELTPSL